MRVLLRTIAGVQLVAAAVAVVAVIHGLGVVLPGRPLGALVILLVGGAFVAATTFAGIQLWRLREVGRVSTIVLLILLMLRSAVLFLLRGQPHVLVRILLEAVLLVIVASKGAREACAASPS